MSGLNRRIFGMAALGLGALAIAAMPGFAEDRKSDNQQAFAKPAATVSDVVPVSTSAASSKPVSLEYADAYMRSEGRVILHYGDGIRDADITGEILRKDPNVDKPVEIYAGANPNEVNLYINYVQFGPFNQYDLDSGKVGAFASLYLQEQAPSQTQQVARHQE